MEGVPSTISTCSWRGADRNLLERAFRQHIAALTAFRRSRRSRQARRRTASASARRARCGDVDAGYFERERGTFRHFGLASASARCRNRAATREAEPNAMIFPLFRREPRPDTISALYGTIVAQARMPAFYRDYAASGHA